MAVELLHLMNRNRSEKFPKDQFLPLIQYINDELGLRIINKRHLKIPKLHKKTVMFFVGRENYDKAEEHLSKLTDFLKSYSIADKFGSNHELRQSTRDKVLERLKDEDSAFANVYNSAYVHNNQLNLNNLSAIQLRVYFLSMLADKNMNIKLKTNLENIFNLLKVRTDNKDKAHNNLPLEKKLEIVHLYEDKIIEVLKLFTRN